MADVTREEAIEGLMMQAAWTFEDTEKTKVYEFAISDMKRVEELEKENEELRKKIETLCCDNFELFGDVAKLETENKRLTEGIEKVKAEIETLANTDFILGTFVNGVTECKDIIKKYLGE